MFSFFTPLHGAWWRLLPFQAMVTHPGTHSCLLLIAGGGNLETLGLLMGLPVAQVVKNLPASRGDAGLIPGSGRSPGGGNDNLLQYSCLENPMDRGAWWAIVHGVAKNWTQLSYWACMHARVSPGVLSSRQEKMTSIISFSGCLCRWAEDGCSSWKFTFRVVCGAAPSQGDLLKLYFQQLNWEIGIDIYTLLYIK